jgi:hypothetical protein
LILKILILKTLDLHSENISGAIRISKSLFALTNKKTAVHLLNQNKNRHQQYLYFQNEYINLQITK